MKQSKLTRRDFLKMAGVSSAGLALSACGIDATRLPDPGGTPSLTPFPAPITAPTLTPTPKPPTMGELARRLGFDIGFSLTMEYGSLYVPACQDFLLNFSTVTDGMASHPNLTDSDHAEGFNYWRDLSDFAKRHDMSLDLNHLFWAFGYFQEGTASHHMVDASKDEVDAYMKNRVEKFFEIPYFTSVNFVNEAIPNDPIHLDYGWGKMYNPFYKFYGKNYPYECYKVAWDEAVKTGRVVGKDIHLIYNTASSEVKTAGADFELRYLAGLKDQLSKELEVERPFDIGMQFHITTAEDKWLWNAKKFDYNSLLEHLKHIAEVGDVRITEFSISDTTDQQEQKDILHTIFEAFVDSKVAKSFMMWDPIGSALNRNVDVMPNLVDGSYKPMFMFDELYKILQSKS
jgi:GH35 family endo-1,4-beta-xylanase